MNVNNHWTSFEQFYLLSWYHPSMPPRRKPVASTTPAKKASAKKASKPRKPARGGKSGGGIMDRLFKKQSDQDQDPDQPYQELPQEPAARPGFWKSLGLPSFKTGDPPAPTDSGRGAGEGIDDAPEPTRESDSASTDGSFDRYVAALARFRSRYQQAATAAGLGDATGRSERLVAAAKLYRAEFAADIKENADIKAFMSSEAGAAVNSATLFDEVTHAVRHVCVPDDAAMAGGRKRSARTKAKPAAKPKAKPAAKAPKKA